MDFGFGLKLELKIVLASGEVATKTLKGYIFWLGAVYNEWMKENGGVIVTIIADMWKGFPGMR